MVFFEKFRFGVLLIGILLIVAFTLESLQAGTSPARNADLDLLATHHTGILHLNRIPEHSLEEIYFYDVENIEENLNNNHGTTPSAANKYDQAVSLAIHLDDLRHSHSGFDRYYILYCCPKIPSSNS